MVYIIMIKVWFKTESGIMEYYYEEYNGIEYPTEAAAEEAADGEFLGDYYIAEKEI